MNRKGLTLIELLVVLAIFSIVMVITFTSYINILKNQTQQSSISSGNLNTVISLQIMRKDVEMAGFGLPKSTSGCNEAVSDSSFTPDPASLNTNCSSPLPFSFSNNNGPNQSDVVAVRSSVAQLSSYAQHWGYVKSDNGSLSFTELGDNGSVNNIYFSIINPKNMHLVENPPCELSSCSIDTGGNIYLAFGLDDISCRMPFNRVDYYLKRPSTNMPKRCSPNTYELYRATINQGDGKRNTQPILDCVMDFQVEFGLDTDNNGIIDTWIPNSGGASLPSDINIFDSELKQIRIFILYQEGKKDLNFNYSGSISLKDNYVNTGKTFTPTGDNVHYRWKKVEIVVNPANISVRKRNLE